MVHLARIEPFDGKPIGPAAPAARANVVAPASGAQPQFSDLEWSIVRLARRDRLWTIRPSGRLRRLWHGFIGRGRPELANPRLEALRRISVLSWHFGFSIPGQDVAEFLSSGFTPEQYELLVTRVGAAARPLRRVIGGEVLV